MNADTNIDMNKPVTTIVEHFTYKNKIIIILSNGNWGMAKCHPKDKNEGNFDIDFGTQLATARAYKNKEMELALINYKYPSNLYNIIKQDKYEIGDKVVIKSLEELKESSNFYEKDLEKIADKVVTIDKYISTDTCRVYRFKELNHCYCLDNVIKGIYKLVHPISANTTSVDTVYQKTSNDNKL